MHTADIAVVEWERVPANVFRAGSRLQHLIVNSTGLGRVDLPAAKAAGVKVSNVPGYSTRSVAEYAFGLLIAMTRGITTAVTGTLPDAWSSYVPGVELAQKKLAVIGYGDIGQTVASMAEAWDMEVLIANRSQVDLAGRRRTRQVSLTEAVSTADFLITCLPAVPGTRKLIDAPLVRSMRWGCFIVSISGPQAFDTAMLMRAVHDGQIAGLAVDRRAEERIEPHPRILQTPDLGWYTDAAIKRNADLILSIVLNGIGEARPDHPT
jgi:phosphoglycerate dehydrogenase-like enzyme